MPRVLLILVALAALVAAWLALSTSPRDPDTAIAPPAPLDTQPVDKAQAPGLATRPFDLSVGERPSARHTRERARSALRAGPAPATVRLAGVVRNRAGEPVRDAEVTAVGLDGTTTWRIGQDGAFQQPLPAGRYALFFEGEGVALVRADVLVDGALAEQEYTLSETGTIVVTVLQDDAPLQGARLELATVGADVELATSGVTGADGSWRVDSLPAGPLHGHRRGARRHPAHRAAHRPRQRHNAPDDDCAAGDRAVHGVRAPTRNRGSRRRRAHRGRDRARERRRQVRGLVSK